MSKKKVKTYTVNLISHASCEGTVDIEATNEKEARKIALVMAEGSGVDWGSSCFSEEVESIEETEEE